MVAYNGGISQGRVLVVGDSDAANVFISKAHRSRDSAAGGLVGQPGPKLGCIDHVA